MTPDKKSSTLGVVAICYNEERDLPGFLTNLMPWVDEIVLVDDGSTDATAKLATGAGAKVKFITSPREEGEYYSDQRNKGIDVAESDWLLHMDIDERVTPELSREILTAIRNDGCDAYRYKRRNYFLHRPMKGGGWADWNLVHLAKRPNLRFGGMFHESCEVDLPAERIGQLRERMLHFNDEKFVERLSKSATYEEESAAWVRRNRGKIGPIRIVWAPVREFLVRYVWKRGFLDGTAGLISALHTATAVFRSHAIVWDEQNEIPREILDEEVEAMWNRDPRD